MAGRGFGKTRIGAEWVRAQVEGGHCKRLALVGRTVADVRDVMVEGESGLLAISPPWFKPKYEPSNRRLTWPNGAIATTYSADKPDQLRGPQHDGAWADELASWRYKDSWDQLQFGLRLGLQPRCVVTTTPRPVPMIRELLKSETTAISRGSSYENRQNLAPAFFSQIVRKYEGTRLGRQELLAELLDDNPYALWKMSDIDRSRVASTPDLKRVVVAIDPAVTANEDSDETGIVVVGLGADDHLYVVGDRSMSGSPLEWATEAIKAYRLHECDRVIAETNQGGDMIESTLRQVDKNIPYEGVRASRGKVTRAEPVAALYEQGRVHHVGIFAKLEDQMTEWVPGEDSPDRMDALVWAVSHLMGFNPVMQVAEGIW